MYREEMQQMEEDIVIAGAGIAGLTTALALHRLGVRSLVVESSECLRITGFALTMWTNAWRALDALGLGDVLGQKSLRIPGLSYMVTFFKVSSLDSNSSGSEEPPQAVVEFGKFESRCVRRKDLLETLERELPQGTIKYSSKIVSIEESGNFKLLHLADGSVLKTKVLIGCDGVNSLVAKWLGLENPVNAGRSAIRGFVDYPNEHGFEPKFHGYFGGGVRYGFIPCDKKSIYWFFTFTPSLFKYDEKENDPIRLKQFVLNNIRNVPKQASDVVSRTTLDFISCASLKFRVPWNIFLGNIVKGDVCGVGDALHPMTPDIGQGGCSALEDSIVLARCLAEALFRKPIDDQKEKDDDDEESVKIKKGLEKYAKERRWRSFSLISTAYVVGRVQESDGMIMSFLRKNFLSKYTIQTVVRMADFDCGKLASS